MDKYQITFQTWNKIAELYQEKFMDLDLYDDSYDSFCQLIGKADAQILEIGCGPGNITRYLLAKRPDFAIHGIDVAPNMIRLAQQNNPKASFEVMDCRELARLKGSYDGIICGFCLPYLSKEDTARLIADCAALLQPGGILYLSAIEDDYEKSAFEAGSSGDKAFVYYHDADFLKEKLEENHFQQTNLIRKSYPKNDGTQQIHLIVLTKK